MGPDDLDGNLVDDYLEAGSQAVINSNPTDVNEISEFSDLDIVVDASVMFTGAPPAPPPSSFCCLCKFISSGPVFIADNTCVDFMSSKSTASKSKFALAMLSKCKSLPHIFRHNKFNDHTTPYHQRIS